MSFLVWNNKKKGDDSLAAINDMYGCPYRAENGYRMDTWDIVIKSNTGNDHGFFKPEERLGMGMDDLMPGLMPGYVEHAKKPVDFFPPDDGIDLGE